jgi:4-hydroxy-tetrahydrodipicolinate reductase
MNYGLIGASGKMGQEIQNYFSSEGHFCVFALDLDGMRQDAVPEVLLDFSQPQVFDTVLYYAGKFNSPLISGTTGLSLEQINSLKNLAKKIPVVQSFSYSKGIQVFLKCVEILSEDLPDWDTAISETHHRFKKDQPSGTALMIKDAMKKEVPITSQRLGHIPGDHTAFFAGSGEVLSLSHSATNRRFLAEGVLQACNFILTKESGFFTFKDVVFGKGNVKSTIGFH